jgi:hypothetical protein
MNYQFYKRWNLGVVADYSSDIEEEKFYSIGSFIGFSPVEESSVFRLALSQQYHGEKNHLNISGQIIWALGPHKPHQF